jgi:hypothetical protein
MAWPSGTKAATTNVDAGTDQPKLARADIKQNIDNVNSIIDELNIASPSDGDLMQYSSSSEQWESVASSNIASLPTLIQLTASSITTGSTADEYTQYTGGFTSVNSGSSGVTISGNNIVFPAGTYFIETIGIGADTDITQDINVTVRFYDSTGETTVASAQEIAWDVGTTAHGILPTIAVKHTFSETSNLIIEAAPGTFNSSSISYIRSQNLILKITKL